MVDKLGVYESGVNILTNGWLMWEPLAATNNYHDWGWLIYTAYKICDDLGMVCGSGFPTLM